MTCPQQSGGILDLGDKQGDCATGLWTGHIGRELSDSCVQPVSALSTIRSI